MSRWRPKRFNTANTRLMSSIEAVSECLTKELSTKQTSAQGKMLAELEKRMKAYDDICKIFGFFSELTSLSIEQIKDKAKNLVSVSSYSVPTNSVFEHMARKIFYLLTYLLR